MGGAFFPSILVNQGGLDGVLGGGSEVNGKMEGLATAEASIFP